MKFLSICDPTRYDQPPLDVPAFYQQLAREARVEFYHLPAPEVFSQPLPEVQGALASGELSYEAFLRLGEASRQVLPLTDIDLVFCRTLKPYPSGYLEVLSRWEDWTRFVNRPPSKQQQMQPDFLLKVAQDYIPDTIVTDNGQEALAFFEQFQVVVAKQANSCGGQGVFKIWYQEGAFQVDNVLAGTRSFSTFAEVMSYLMAGHAAPVQLCRYLHRTDAGDKRVVVVDGEIYGSYLRRSQSGHWVNNVSSDGVCTLAPITQDEVDAIHNTVGHYQALGLHTLGYDFLMDDDGTWRISEINAGNIGGFARLERLTGRPVMDRLISWMMDYAQRPRLRLVEAADYPERGVA